MFDLSTPPPAEGYAGEGGAAEWAARVELANGYRIVANLGKADWGWTHCVCVFCVARPLFPPHSRLTAHGPPRRRYNHITLKLPDSCAAALGVPDREGGLFLINAFGCRFDEVTPESLHTVDLDGVIVRNGAPIAGCPDRGVLIAGFTIHSAVHKARPDIKAIFHTHHPDVVAVCSLKCGLLPCSNEGCLSLAALAPERHPFEGPATDDSEKARIAAALGPSAMTLMLDNHGVICCGANLQCASRRRLPPSRARAAARLPRIGAFKPGPRLRYALRNIWVFTKAAGYQVKALSAAGGDPDRMVLVPRAIVDACTERELRQQKQPLGLVEYEAWLRGPAI